jgi:hypothetical protein
MLVDFIRETVSAGGAGDLTLSGAVSGHQTFDNGVGQDHRFPYAISDGATWEVGVGLIDSATNFVRETFHDSSSGSALTVTTAAEVFLTENEASAWEGSSPASGTLIANISETGATTGDTGDDGLVYCPFTLLYPGYYDGFAFIVASGGGDTRVGLYDVKAGLPHNLIAKHDTTPFDATGSGLKHLSFDDGSIWLSAGQYFMCVFTETSTFLETAADDSCGGNIVGSDTSFGAYGILYTTLTFTTLSNPAYLTGITAYAFATVRQMLEAT